MGARALRREPHVSAGEAMGDSATVDLSVVIPAFDEAESIAPLAAELRGVLDATGRSWEVLFVDDGSRDGTAEAIATLAGSDRRFKGVSFRRNFGKSAALATGFRAARGERVVTMDADLQDDPAELPKLMAKLDEGFDLVSGWKQNRQDPITKTLPSRLFNAVTSQVAGVRLHDFNCGFKIYRREVTQAVEVYGEFHRFMPALAHWAGFRVAEVPVHHRSRKFGRSKFGAARFINGFLDLMSAAFISTSALKPLHVFGRIGLGFFGAGFLIGLFFVAQWLLGEPMRVRPLMLLGVGLVILGIQFVLMGLLGDMIAHLGAHRVYPERRRWNLDSRG